MSKETLKRKRVEIRWAEIKDVIGRADQNRFEKLIPFIGEEGLIRLSNVLGTLYPHQKKESALTSFRQFRQRLRQKMEKAHIHFELKADTQIKSLPEDRHCWFEGEDAIVAEIERFSEERTKPLKNEQHIPQRGDEISGSREKNIDVLRYLSEWVKKPDSPSFCALLGDYGMGKTTSCKAITRLLLKNRKNDSNVPLPIYLDLREYRWDKQVDFTLEKILKQVLENSGKGGYFQETVSASDVVALVQKENALIIFDGLDEVIIQMEPKLAEDFIRQLWRILPERKSRKRNDLKNGKLLISCRTHYFRNTQEQAHFLRPEQSDGGREEDCQVLVLSPFNDEQIKNDLSRKASQKDLPSLTEDICDLSEMIKRPYALSLIAHQISETEGLQLRGEKIYGFRFCESIVAACLLRDEGKHQFNRQHKQILMEHLASAFWESEQTRWDAETLETWLDDFLFENPRLAEVYQNFNREVLKKDLRGATFLVRRGRGEDEGFCFAQSVLHAYFQACHLHRALKEGRRKLWAIKMPSKTTRIFLGELIDARKKDHTRCVFHLKNWLETYEAGSGELAFWCWLESAQTKGPLLRPPSIDLKMADLSGWKISGKEGARLNLRHIQFQGSCLGNAVFAYVNLSRSNFSKAHMQKAEFHESQLMHSDFKESLLDDTIWRLCDLRNLDFRSASLSRSRWVRNKRSEVLWAGEMSQNVCFAPEADRPENFSKITLNNPIPDRFRGQRIGIRGCAFNRAGTQIVSASQDHSLKVWDVKNGKCLKTLIGHSAAVNGCAFKGTGTQIVSASDDHSLKIWDAKTGECLKTLIGHGGAVRSCAFNEAGTEIVSSSHDRSLKVWDAKSGECLHTLSGHGNWILGCAFNSAGTQIVSASDDHSLKIWDAKSGECLQTLNGHGAWVRGCAFNASGTKIVSASHDHSLKIWDTNSGECLQTLIGHAGGVWDCDFNGTGIEIISASDDHSLKVWDTKSGECLQTLSGHSSRVLSCAFDEAGAKIVSTSHDHSLKVWDLKRGECLATSFHLPNSESATIDEKRQRFIDGSESAWRYLCYRDRRLETDEARIWPAEFYGPLCGAN